MAKLLEQTTTKVLKLQRRLLTIIDQATAVSFLILERYSLKPKEIGISYD